MRDRSQPPRPAPAPPGQKGGEEAAGHSPPSGPSAGFAAPALGAARMQLPRLRRRLGKQGLRRASDSGRASSVLGHRGLENERDPESAPGERRQGVCRPSPLPPFPPTWLGWLRVPPRQRFPRTDVRRRRGPRLDSARGHRGFPSAAPGLRNSAAWKVEYAAPGPRCAVLCGQGRARCSLPAKGRGERGCGARSRADAVSACPRPGPAARGQGRKGWPRGKTVAASSSGGLQFAVTSFKPPKLGSLFSGPWHSSMESWIDRHWLQSCYRCSSTNFLAGRGRHVQPLTMAWSTCIAPHQLGDVCQVSGMYVVELLI